MTHSDFDVNLRGVKSLETEKIAGKTNYRIKFDLSLVLLMVLIVCTAYVLMKFI